MPRPISTVPPPWAVATVASKNPDMELPSMDLPNFPDIPDVPGDVPAGGGAPSLDAPGFRALSLPTEAQAEVEIPAAHLPDFFIFEA